MIEEMTSVRLLTASRIMAIELVKKPTTPLARTSKIFAMMPRMLVLIIISLRLPIRVLYAK